jgi:GTP-binding protein
VSDPSPLDILAAEFVAAASVPGSLPPARGPELAFAGRSNVGKSSLMNALMRRKNLVRTSGTPGCTRQINFFSATARDGESFTLVDLPGYGYAQRAKHERKSWGELIEQYLLEREALAAVVLLVDARRGLEPDDRQLEELLASRAGKTVKLVMVATKIDKLPASKRRAATGRLAREQALLGVSAVSGEGIEPLWRALRKTLQ